MKGTGRQRETFMCPSTAHISDQGTAKDTLPETENHKETIPKGREIKVHTSSYTGSGDILKVHHRSLSLHCTVYWGPFTG